MGGVFAAAAARTVASSAIAEKVVDKNCDAQHTCTHSACEDEDTFSSCARQAMTTVASVACPAGCQHDEARRVTGRGGGLHHAVARSSNGQEHARSGGSGMALQFLVGGGQGAGGCVHSILTPAGISPPKNF